MPVYIHIEENPNCAPMDGLVFQPRERERPVQRVLYDRDGESVWCDVTGMNADGRPVNAMASLIDDSGDGACYLIHGGEWGLRLRASGSQRDWDLRDGSQWGEPYLLLPASADFVQLL